MVGSLATTNIITKGLSCGPACLGIVTSHFSLYVQSSPSPPAPTPGGGGGGPYPGPAWNKVANIQQFYRPVQAQEPYLVPQDPNIFGKNLVITLKIKIAGSTVEKTYAVAEKHSGVVVRAFSVMDATRKKMKVSVQAIKNIAHRFTATVRNIRVKRNPNK